MNHRRNNANINSNIHELAEEDTLYKTNIVTQAELKAFIKATQTIATGSFTTVSFDPVAIASLTPAERAIVADSIIVRSVLTTPLEAMALLKGYVIPLPNSYYEGSDPLTFLTKIAVLEIIAAP